MRRPVHCLWPPYQTAQSSDEAGGVIEITHSNLNLTLTLTHGFYRFHITLILTLTLTLKRAPKHFLGELFSKKHLGKFQQLTHSICFNGRTFNAHNSGTVRRRHLKTRSVGHNSSTLNTPDLFPSLCDLPFPRYTLCIFHRFESAISRERKLVATGRRHQRKERP